MKIFLGGIIMVEKRVFDMLGVDNWLESSMERPPHPSIYKKIKKTEKMIKDGEEPKTFVDKGGLDIETYKNLKKRNDIYNESIDKMNLKLHSAAEKGLDINQLIGVRLPCEKSDKVTGTRRALVLPVDFKDHKNQTTAEYFQDMLFKKGSNSLRDYYLEASWNQLDIIGDVSEWFTAKNAENLYLDKLPAKNPDTGGIYFPNAQKLVAEAVQNAVKGDIDLSKYDYNGDGIIDMLIVIYAGVGFDTAHDINFITPHTGYLNDPIIIKKGKKEYQINKYSIIPELSSGNLKPVDLGCFCHEIAHVLGIPELYHLDFSSKTPEFAPVMGDWCLMGVGSFVNNGANPTHMGAWCKIKLGWTEPEVVTGKSENYDIPVVIDPAKKIYKLEVPKLNGKEYFLLENREQKGFDKYIPADGLLIWHVDENKCVGDFPNSDKKHYFLSVVQADGKRELEATKNFKEPSINGDAGDVYPGTSNNRSLDDTTTPNSKSYTKKPSGITIKSITDPGDKMTAIMGVKGAK